MPLDVHLLLIGMATAVDTALLLSLLERRNLRSVTTPIVLLLVATWLLHSGEFARGLLRDAQSGWSEFATWLAMSWTATGLILMPCSLLHGVLRLWRTGLNLRVKPAWGYAAAYLPLLILPWAMYVLSVHRGLPFLDRAASLVTPVAVLICGVNVLAIAAFLRQCRRSDPGETRQFFAIMAGLLTGLTALVAYSLWIAPSEWLAPSSPLLHTLVLAPLGPTLVFTYFVIRYRFMQLLLERTLVYGVILALALLFHRVVVQAASKQLGDRFRVDFGVLEGVAVFLLVLLYAPIRRRVAESLHYLLGRGVTDLRQQTRRLAVEMWQHLDDEPRHVLKWFVDALRETLGTKLAAVWLFDTADATQVRCGDTLGFTEDHIQMLHRGLTSHAFVAADGRGIPDVRLIDLLRQLKASFAVRLDHAGFSGLLIVGPRHRAREYGDEEINSVMLLVELLGATLHSHLLQTKRLQAERLAYQREKLSTLGLLTSCLAHEIKNPLSSIKTIATVMAEQFGSDHPQAEDLRLILGEVERLSTTTGQFLQFARPAELTQGSAAIAPVVDGTLQILTSLAKGKDVTIESMYESDLPEVGADEHTLREIMFNLVLNAIEAVDRGGRVRVDIRRNGQFVVTTVSDNGPGIDRDVRGELFAPFVTSKPAGTGLGLFIVRRHVEQLGGQITCDSKPRETTCFTVKLPFAPGGKEK